MTGSRLLRLGLASLACCALAWSPSPQAAKIKCWTNDEGVRECGNAVPPEYAQKGHTEKSESGVTTSRQKRAKTKAELEAERAEQERLAKEREEEEERRKLQAERDRVLLATFTTEDDLLLTRDGQVRAIESRIKHAEQVVAKLESNLAELEAEAAKEERSGKSISDKLKKNIESVKAQIAENLAFVDAQHEEKAALVEKYERDLARYRELKGTTASTQ